MDCIVFSVCQAVRRLINVKANIGISYRCKTLKSLAGPPHKRWAGFYGIPRVVIRFRSSISVFRALLLTGCCLSRRVQLAVFYSIQIGRLQLAFHWTNYLEPESRAYSSENHQNSCLKLSEVINFHLARLMNHFIGYDIEPLQIQFLHDGCEESYRMLQRSVLGRLAQTAQ